VTHPAGRPDHPGDGDGWVRCAQGHRHWGRFGAAGLLAHRAGPGGDDEVLLQHRAEWSHHGGTWGLLGGARTSGESALQAALREAAEEGGVDPGLIRVEGRYDDDHGGWSYVTVLAAADPAVTARPTGGESIDVVWQPVDRVFDLPLHPGFAHTWPLLRPALRPLQVVVDVANVMGSRPDGWWRDPAAAARRIIAACAALARRGVPAHALPREMDWAPLHHVWPRLHLVLEGAARRAAGDAPPDVHVVVAPGSGDDAIVATTAALGPPTLVVTADRELRRRCAAAGAVAAGPRWLLGLLDSPDTG
jgi:8-oxo-dGTP pyrophosphatase MutT (NUDIX family)